MGIGAAIAATSAVIQVAIGWRARARQKRDLGRIKGNRSEINPIVEIVRRPAVLGAREVGKTNLIQFLTSGSIPAEYRWTRTAEKARGRRFQLRDLVLKVKDMLDVPGSKEAYSVWKQVYRESDLVLYLVRADRLLAKDANAEQRVRDDFGHIASWREDRKSPPAVCIVGTYCDLDPKYPGASHPGLGSYHDKFRALPIVKELVARAGGGSTVNVVLGSLKTVRDTEGLVFQVFSQVGRLPQRVSS